MKNFKKLAFWFMGFSLSFSVIAQNEEPEPSLDAGTLDSQFEYVIDESNNYQQYEVIPSTWMNKLRSNVSDTLEVLHTEINSLSNELADREENIEELTSDLENTRDTLTETRTAQDEMAFLGVSMKKASYRVLMWSIIGVLVLLLLIFIFRFNRSNAVTRQSKEALASVQEEFDQHRKRSLEREQKLRRELQDELNKQQRGSK